MFYNYNGNILVLFNKLTNTLIKILSVGPCWANSSMLGYSPILGECKKGERIKFHKPLKGARLQICKNSDKDVLPLKKS